MVQESVGAQDELEPGEAFAGRYRVERLLGEGDRKKTFLAEDMTVRDRLVAISIVRPHAVNLDADGTRREANLLSRVGTHSHIVALHDCNVDGPVQYLVFEYLPGGTLAELIQSTADQGQRLSPELIVRFGRQLAGALAQVHAAGIIHRDVAPHNVWLTSQGARDKVKLGDFDSAILVNPMLEHRPITSEGFASPEERHGGQLDQRSDLYSLGGTLISMARGRLDFENPHALVDERRDLPSPLTELLISLVAPLPGDRPGNAEEVLNRLRQVDESLDLYAIIASGEGPEVEFKASMRFPRDFKPPALAPTLSDEARERAIQAKWQKTSENLEHSVVKTIAAFLNSRHGGTLLVGVTDGGHIAGVEADFQTLPDELGKDLDGWQLNLKDKIKKFLDTDVWASLQLTLHHVNTATVARLDCPPRGRPTWLSSKQSPEFYIRAGAASEPLASLLWSQYISERWLS